jgi:hypothetical protein
MKVSSRRVFQFAANLLHNVKGQLLVSTIFGLIYLYGVRGTLAILMKVRQNYAREQQAIREKKSKVSRVQQGSGNIQRDGEQRNV